MPKITEKNINNKDNKILVEQFDNLVNQIKYDISKEKDKKKITQLNFKLRHFKKIISIIRNYPNQIKTGEDLKDVKGIGKGTIERINEILKTKNLKEVNKKVIKEITKKNNILEDLASVINIGPKIAKELYKEHKITSVKELKDKIKSGDIKVNDKIMLGLKYHGKVKLKIPRKEMDQYNEFIKNNLDNDLIITMAGSYRREKQTSNDIDIIISHKNIKSKKEYKKLNKNYLQEFVCMLKKKKIIVDDLTDVNNETKYMGFCKLKRKPVRRIDIRFVPFDSYYFALLYFTGSYELNTQMRQIAKKMSYKLNEYGLYKIRDDGKVSTRSIKVKSEEEIFKKLKMEYIEPSQRG